MDLVQTVMTRVGVDEEKARQGLGTVFIAIRMAVDMRTFTQISTEFTTIGEWMLVAPFQDGGTGEMLATATPGAVRRLLAYAGYDESHSAELCTVIGEALRERTPDSFETVAAKLPLF